MRESSGGAVAVSDRELMDWVPIVSSLKGVQVCPEGAATAVAAKKLIEQGEVSPDETLLLLNTASLL